MVEKNLKKCPKCGRLVPKLTWMGLCQGCTLRAHHITKAKKPLEKKAEFEKRPLPEIRKEVRNSKGSEGWQRYIEEIRAFIQTNGKALGPTKTLEEVKRRWPSVWTNLEARRQIGGMIRSIFSTEEWKRTPEEKPKKIEKEKPEERGFFCKECGAWITKYPCKYCHFDPRKLKRKKELEKGWKVVKGGLVGSIISIPLAVLGWIPLWIALLILGGCLLIAYTPSKWVRWPVGIGIVLALIYFLMSVPLIQSILPMGQINEIIYELNLKRAYVECLITHMTDVENIMNYGGLDALCKKLITEVQAVKEGCTECLELKVETEVPLAIPGRSYLFRLEYNMDEGADLPATNITSTFYIDDEPLEDGLTRCNEKDPCILYPGDWEESSVRLSKYEIPCEKDSFKYTVVTRYNYTSRGYTHFYITDNRRIYEKRKAITSSGPLDIVVASDSSYYRKDEDARIFLAFTFVNKGKGEIRINDVTIIEMAPKNIECSNDGCSLLDKAANNENSYCDYEIENVKSMDGERTFIWKIKDEEMDEDFRRVSAEKKCLFVCEIYINDFFEDLRGAPYVTYTYEVIVNYTYEKNQTGQVWVDTTYPCYTRLTEKWWKGKLINCSEISSGGGCSPDEKNGKEWYEKDYNDSSWKTCNFPEEICTNCSKFYRRKLFWDNSSTVWLNFTATESGGCFVNGKECRINEKNITFSEGEEIKLNITSCLDKSEEKQVIACCIKKEEEGIGWLWTISAPIALFP